MNISKKLKKVKVHKLTANKSNVNGRINIKLNNKLDKITEYNNLNLSTNIIHKIKSKSSQKSKVNKIINGMNKLPVIKLPVLKNKKLNSRNNKEKTPIKNLKLKQYFNKDYKSKLKLKTDNNYNYKIKNFYSTQNSKKSLLNKIRDNSYNLKKSENSFMNKSMNLTTNSNSKITRHLDRKKLKESNSILLSKHKPKLFQKENKFKSNNDYTNNKTKNKKIIFHHKKINALFEINKKDKKVGNLLSNSIKNEINDEIIYESKINEKDFDIISDISLSDEELNFTEEDSFDNMEFSLEDEEI